MDQYELIRTAHRVYGKSIRTIARETGHHRSTIRKALAGVEPQYHLQQERSSPVMEPVAGVIKEWLKEDPERPEKQRHTARRVYTRLVEEKGFQGAESTVRRWVREAKADLGLGSRQAMVPLDPEAAREAEVDWGSALARINGEEARIKMFCMRSRFSGKSFVKAYPWERQEMFLDGHVRAFDYYTGVFPVLVYDNLSVAVRQILRGRQRIEQDRFVSFRSYYTFKARFCNPNAGHEKGGVEGLVGFARRNFLVPLPEVEDFEELNRMLLERCAQHSLRIIAGREDRRTIQERHDQEKADLIDLPDHPFENSRPIQVKVDAYQTARVDRNRYSVPGAWVGRWVWAHVGCEQVELYGDGKRIAGHPRAFSNGKWQLDPQHYLGLIERRPGSFEAARPIRQWRARWPEQYERMLGRLRERQGENAGTGEFVRMLKLHASYPSHQVEQAIGRAFELGSCSCDSVRQLLEVGRGKRADFPALEAGRLPGVTDRDWIKTDVSRYNRLLTGGER